MLEGPPPAIPQGPISLKPTLETIPEVSSTMEKGSENVPPEPMGEPVGYQMPHETVFRPSHRFHSEDDVPEIDEKWAKEMWDSVHTKVQELLSSIDTPPLSEVDLGHPWEKHLENLSFQEDIQTRASARSKHTLHTMPSYLGEYEGQSTVVKIPSTRRELPREGDRGNLHAILSAPVTCTLPLIDLLKLKPDLWNDLTGFLAKQGLLSKRPIPPTEVHMNDIATQADKQVMPVPINKVGQYCEDDQGNATLPMAINDVVSLAILDSGAGVSIATKTMWEKWGKPAIRSTRMRLQLADGSLESPIGLLEAALVKSCGIEYEHNFAIVDFGKETNYEVILGRPFMRQLRMIQDWGYNYLYLRHDSVITRVNLKNHSYRDVTRSPVDEFDSASSEATRVTVSDGKEELWMCGASRKDFNPERLKGNRSISDESYVPQPFPEHLIDPLEWTHVLATLSTCALPKPIQFCDSDGYDIVPIRMIQPITRR